MITKLHEMMDKAFFLKISNLIDRTFKVFQPGWCYLSSESPVLVTWEGEWWPRSPSDIVRFPNPLASWQLGMVVHGSWGTWLQWHDPGVTLRQRQPGHVDVHRPEQGKSLQLGWNPRAMLLCNRGTEQARGGLDSFTLQVPVLTFTSSKWEWMSFTWSRVKVRRSSWSPLVMFRVCSFEENSSSQPPLKLRLSVRGKRRIVATRGKTTWLLIFLCLWSWSW